MRKTVLILSILFPGLLTFGTIPPKKGIKPSQSFIDFHKMIQPKYSEGYFARKFREKKELREKIRLNKSGAVMETDTVFALTLMGQYSDLSGNYTQEDFQAQIFDGPNPTGTVTDYYNQISYGQLHFTGTCNGWYDMPGTLEDYVGDNNGLGLDGGPKFVYNLVRIADSTLNYADYIQYYDGGGKPHIGFIAVVHSGADAAAGANNIWSHRWSFREYNGGPYVTNDTDPVSGENVVIDGDYALEPERNGSSNTSGSIVAIGVFAHEFGHIFGLPDLYDTDNSSEGLGNWCLMAGGAYGGNGNTSQTPVQMSAWCKYQLGWVTPVNLTGANNSLSVPNVEENPVVYRMWKDGIQGQQYFLIENRQRIGNDINIYDSGFLIYHVDDSQNDNTNENHYLVDLEQADGRRDLNKGNGRGDAGDPFPGSFNNINFGPDTNPNSKDYSSQNTFVSVRNIHKSGADMIADFDIGTVPYLELESIDLAEINFQNGRVEPGETCNLSFTIKNVGRVNSENASISFSINQNEIEILNNEMELTLNGNTTKTFTIDSAFYVTNDFQPKVIQINYEIVGEGNVVNDSLSTVIGIPAILLLSKAENNSLSEYYKSALNELEMGYEETFEDTASFISRRSFVIVFSGKSTEEVFTPAEIDSLTGYINNGGNVFFTGQNLAQYFENEAPDFLHNTVGISWNSNMLLPQYAFGVSNDQFGDQLDTLMIKNGDGANNQIGPDVLVQNDTSFHFSFTYREDGTKPAGGWIIKPSGAKIIFWGFGFEGISNLVSSATRAEVMDDIIQWFNTLIVAIPPEHKIPSDYKLYQNFPNPFNPSTTISYQLPVKGNVSLKIYDILGREVQTIVNEVKNAGKYQVNFDASSLTSGVYFYKIKTDRYSEVKKMILIK